ncbi:VOC family protein [Mucilaginibacter sp. McL0603]|uniref:VOC family protein n=1 Tax=Mucilaginibacter sp. McL0603 TaxID=3415670 RepID=UPI003CF41808
MAIVNSYLNFNGNTEEAFNFYKSVFGTEFSGLMRFKDAPGGDKMQPSDKEKLMHISLPVGNGNTLMATDILESQGQVLKEGNNFSLSISPDSEDEGNRFFNGLSAGGKVEVPFSKAFWGAYFGMFTDKFGIRWMINYDPNQSK